MFFGAPFIGMPEILMSLNWPCLSKKLVTLGIFDSLPFMDGMACPIALPSKRERVMDVVTGTSPSAPCFPYCCFWSSTMVICMGMDWFIMNIVMSIPFARRRPLRSQGQAPRRQIG